MNSVTFFSDEGVGIPYQNSTSSLEVNEKIQKLIEKAKVFKPLDEKEVKKVFYHNSVGVFVYARDNQWNGDIYFAKEGDHEFVKTDSRKFMECRCANGESSWHVLFSSDNSMHLLNFAQGKGSPCSSDTSWDGQDLKEIHLS